MDAFQIDGGSSDNCTLDSSWVFPATFDCSNVGSNSITLFVADLFGNIDSCTALVEVNSGTSELTCNDTTLTIDATGVLTVSSSNVLDPAASGACSFDSLVFSPASFSCADIGVQTVEVISVDFLGDSDSCSANLILIDTLSPIAACLSSTVYMDVSGSMVLDPADIDDGSSDNCGIEMLSVSPETLDCSNLGTTTVTLFVQDFGGRISSCSSTITVLDTNTVTTLCKNDTLYQTSSGFVPLTFENIVDGFGGNCSISTFSISKPGYNCFELGVDTVSITINYTDGSEDSCQSVITVLDTLPTTATCRPATVYLNGLGTATLSPEQVFTDGGPTCQIDTLILSESFFTCAEVGSQSITLTAINYLGDTSNCSSTVNILDTLTPVMICKPVEVALDPLSAIPVSSADLNNGSSDNCGLDTLFASPDSLTVATILGGEVTLIGIDVNGNVESCVSTIIVTDTVDGNPFCLDIDVYLDSAGSVSVDPIEIFGGGVDPTEIDTMVISPLSFGCAPPDLKIATLSVTMETAEILTCSSTVNVMDSIFPEMLCNDLSVYLGATGSYLLDVNELDGGTTDNCGIASLFASQLSFDCTDTGSAVVTLSALDAKGNLDSCFSNVEVLDTLSPVPACSSATISIDTAGNAVLLPSNIDAGSTDNCGITLMTVSQDTFDCTEIGNHLITLTLTDGSGNTSSCQSLVTVEDILPPVLSCMDIVISLDSNGMRTLDPSEIDTGSADNCALSSLAVSQDLFSCVDIGTVTVQLYALDVNGNLDSCSSNVMVMDTFAITVTCPADQMNTNDLVFCGNSTIPMPTLRPGCFGSAVFVNSFNGTSDASDIYPMGETVVGYTVYDGAGDSATCSFTVTIENSLGTAPPALSPGAPYPLCTGDTLTLDAGATYFQYEWNTGDTTRFISTASSGTFFCKVFNGFGPNCWRYTDTAEVFGGSLTSRTDHLYGGRFTRFQPSCRLSMEPRGCTHFRSR